MRSRTGARIFTCPNTTADCSTIRCIRTLARVILHDAMLAKMLDGLSRAHVDDVHRFINYRDLWVPTARRRVRAFA